MLEKHRNEGLALANRQGVYSLRDYEEYIPDSDGCSGFLSEAYKKFGETISCQECCYMHDWLYVIGGDYLQRLRVDWWFCRCTAMAGKTPSGIKGIPLRIWRMIRSYFILYRSVRTFGGFFWGKP